MIRHHVLITLNDDAKDVADEIVAELTAYAPGSEHVRSYKVGRDLDLAAGTADVAVVAEFDDIAGYQAYSADPDHVDIIERLIKPNVAGLVRCQTEF